MKALPNAYLNGEFLPLNQARISPLDRGFLFGDAIYEVVPVYGGQPFLLSAHLQRMARSLKALHIDCAMSESDWTEIVSTLSAQADGDVAVYLQVSRGGEDGRDHLFPLGMKPTVFALASELPKRDVSQGISAITRPDNRWGRCDIKATALLANVLALHEAREANAAEAILLWDGDVTEGATSSVIIAERGQLYRRPNGAEILPGTTTEYVVDIARQLGIECHDETISEARLRGADEIWLLGATRGMAPVVNLDGAAIGSGKPGPLWQRVCTEFEARRRGAAA